MAEENDELATYLRDHYAGGVGAVELLARLIKAQEESELKAFFEELCADVKSDHELLHSLMSGLKVKESSMRDAAAWMAEKFSRPKLSFGSQEKGLVLLQALETLFMGITGKRMLWSTLHEQKGKGVVWQNYDFQGLQTRASRQLERVEAKRREIARKVFAKPADR